MAASDGSEERRMKLKDRISMVTGAAQGIGAAIAREFAREGAIVAALDRKGDVEKVCAEIRRTGGDASAQSGRIDTLVNNAAVWRPGDILSDKLEEWREVQEINLEAVYWGCKLVAPHMARPHHYHRIGSGDGDRWRRRLECRGQGRSGQLHQIAGGRTRATWGISQRDRSGFHSHAHVDR